MGVFAAKLIGRVRLATIQVYLRDYFAQRSIRPALMPGIRFKHIYTGAMGSVWVHLMAGVFLVYFGNRIGMTRFQWGLMGSIASLVLLGEVVSAAVTQHVGRRKLIWFVCATLDRGLRFVGIALALLLWHHGWEIAPWVLIGSISLATCLGAMAGPPWLSWLADLIPEKEHGEFWGRRSAWVALAVIGMAVPAGLLMDHTPESMKMRYTLLVFVAATAVGLLDLAIHGTIPEPQMTRPPRTHFFQQLMEPLKDRGFRPLLWFNFCWTFAIMIGATLLMVYLMEDLGCNKRFAGITIATTVCYLGGGVLSGRKTGQLVDRWGPKRVMFWGYLYWSLVPLSWLFLTKTNVLYIIGAVNLVAGVLLTAGMNGAIKIQTRYPPKEHRAMYIAVSNSVNYIAASLAALCAGSLVKWLGDWSWTVRHVNFNPYDLLAVISLVLRIAAFAFLLKRLPEPPPERLEIPEALQEE